MSVVAEGLIEHLKSEMKRANNISYENAYNLTRLALERALGALEQIDHDTKNLKFKVEIVNE